MNYLSLVYGQCKRAADRRSPWTAKRHLPVALRARLHSRSTLVTDGPFVETKEFVGGI